MKQSKKASEIVAGDKVYTTLKPNMPATVEASYAMGERWVLEVEGVAQMLQHDPNDVLQIWTT